MENILKLEKIEKYYGNKSSLTKAINNISFEVDKGEFVAIMGASGSGKTTLLNVISTIDKVTSGHIYVGGEDITKLKGNALNKFRREELGFIFQDFNLLDTLTAYENIALSLSIQNFSVKEIDEKIRRVSNQLNIKDVLNKYPYQMSGGQKQRVVISRAFLKDSSIIIFDDTFSALDNRTSKELLENIKDLSKDKTCIIISNKIADVKQSDKIIVLNGGNIIQQGVHEELINVPGIYQEFFKQQSTKAEPSFLS